MKKNLYLTSLIFFLTDILTKMLILTNGDVIFYKEIIPNFFKLQLTYNNGAAFSMFQGYQIFLIIISIGVIVYLDRYFIKENISKLQFFSTAMIIGGTLGNLTDRLLDGYVTDFLAFKIFNYNFPVFNIADIFITIGALLLIIVVIKGGKDENKSRSK